MAVYTDVQDDDLRLWLQRYTIGDLLSYRGIAEGIENSNFFLHTTEGQYILTLYEKRVSENDLPFFLTLLQHLAGKGIPCPQPLSQRDASVVGQLSNRPAAIFTFLEGVWLRRPEVVHCKALGRALAMMHVASYDFALRRQNSMAVDSWCTLWQQTRKHVHIIKPGIEVLVDDELEFLHSSWPGTLPKGIIHGDLFPDNVFFIRDEISGLIDFYFACYDVLAYDIAIVLNAWCFERDFSFNLTKAQAILKYYQQVRPLSDAEIAALPILARGAALRFFLTRLYDWFNTPPNSMVNKKDPEEYWRKLQFFRNIRHLRELGL